MNKNFYSNTEFNDLKRRLNDEIRRRGTFRWWDPLTTPSVGEDKSSPLSLPKNDNERIFVDDKTYTINNPSTGSIEPTKNIQYPERGENPGGEESSIYNSAPNTSAALVTADEMRNYLIGLSKIQDINLFYGKDEIPGISYRDPQGIEDAVIAAENSKLNVPLHESDLDPVKNDPNGGNKQSLSDGYPVQNHPVEYPMENGIYVMSSGETDGEEITNLNGLGPDNFFDDYGAKPGDGNYHPYNRAKTPQTRRDWEDQNNDRIDGE